MIESYLPVDVVFHPNWWHQNYGLSFDRDFFYDPERRVWQEQRMRHLLYERFGDLGLGQKDAPRRPIVGPILMGSGYIVQEILGCEVKYHESYYYPTKIVCSGHYPNGYVGGLSTQIFITDFEVFVLLL